MQSILHFMKEHKMPNISASIINTKLFMPTVMVYLTSKVVLRWAETAWWLKLMITSLQAKTAGGCARQVIWVAVQQHTA